MIQEHKKVWAPAKFWTSQELRFPTAEGGSLTVSPDGFVPYRFRFGVQSRFAYLPGVEVYHDYLRSIVRLCDSAGIVWEAESVWDTWDFLRLRGLDFLSYGLPVPESSANPAVREAFVSPSQRFLSGASAPLEDWGDQPFIYENRVVRLPFHFVSPDVDLAFVPSRTFPKEESTLWVRISGLEMVETQDADSEGEQTEMPPLVYPMTDCDQLWNSRYTASDPANAASCNYSRSHVSRPVVFSRTAHKGKRCDRVLHQSA